jgi:hypothetical protein
MIRQKFELAHIIKRFGKHFVQRYNPNAYILHILNAVLSNLGGMKMLVIVADKYKLAIIAAVTVIVLNARVLNKLSGWMG